MADDSNPRVNQTNFHDGSPLINKLLEYFFYFRNDRPARNVFKIKQFLGLAALRFLSHRQNMNRGGSGGQTAQNRLAQTALGIMIFHRNNGLSVLGG